MHLPGGRPLRDAVDEREAALFVGRRRELDRFAAALVRRPAGARVFYVQGSPGVGKSALLRAYRRLAAGAGIATVSLDGQVVEPTPVGVLRAIAGHVSVVVASGGGDVPPLAASVVRALEGLASASGLLLLVDAYEQLLSCDRWLRSEIFGALGPGAVLTLAGRGRPRDLWPADRAWRSQVEEVQLEDIPEDEALELLERYGVVEEGLRRGAVSVAGGRPLLLGLVADALPDGGVPLAPVSAEGGLGPLVLGLLERLLHPDSTRRAWEADDGSPAGLCLAAASMLRSFDRAVVESMLEPSVVARGWPVLVDLPVVRPVGGRFLLHEVAREQVAAAVSERRPWTVHRWRRLAIEHHLAAVASARPKEVAGEQWAELTCLATECLWHTWLYPESEAHLRWRFERGASPADLPQLVQCRAATLARTFGVGREGLASVPTEVGELLAAYPEGFVLARGPAGEILGYSVAVPLLRATRTALLGEPATAAYLRWLGDEALAGMEGRLLTVGQMGLRDPADELYFALFREVFRELAHYRQMVVLTALSAAERFAPLVGGARVPGFEVMLPGRHLPNRAYRIDLAGIGYARWLEELVAPPGLAPASADERAAAAREALEALNDPPRLRTCAVARHCARVLGDGGPRSVRAWLLDALASGRFSSEFGAELLRGYYVERALAHEALAEALHLSRRTYFRHLHQSLVDLGGLLFS